MLIDKIKKDRMDALKAKDTQKKDLLGVLLGDCTKVSKEPTDEFVVSIVKKFINNCNLTMDSVDKLDPHADPRGDSIIAASLMEISILEEYLPAQMSEDAIKIAIEQAKNLGNTDMKSIMSYFKSMFSGRYDGAVVSKLVKEVL